jgi:hypothetical protein
LHGQHPLEQSRTQLTASAAYNYEYLCTWTSGGPLACPGQGQLRVCGRTESCVPQYAWDAVRQPKPVGPDVEKQFFCQWVSSLATLHSAES